MPPGPIDRTALEQWISPPRAAEYLDAAGDDATRALELYQWNGRLAAALLEALGEVEVTVRNAVHA